MNILVVGPHPDDQELGMGGTILRLAAQGHQVLVLDITNGEPTPLGSVEQREREWTAALEVLNRQAAQGGRVTRRLLGLPNRFVEHTIEARHAVAGVMREHRAEMVFLPFEQDAHPDHRAVTRIVEDARFDAKLSKIDLPGEPVYPKWMVYYYCTHLRWVADPTFCMDITGQMDDKEASIVAYETQFVQPEKNRRVVEFVREMNGYMGSRIGTRYAEPFFMKEPMGLGSLSGLA
ncbi:MAG: PIG-L family deacetylase [Planctomycetota bacterium]